MPTGQTITSIGKKIAADGTGELQQAFGATSQKSMKWFFEDNASSVNPMSRYKPFRNAAVYNGHYSQPSSGRLSGLVNSSWGLEVPAAVSNPNQILSTKWECAMPRGSAYNEPYRAMDFEGYYPDAAGPVHVENLSDLTLTVYGNNAINMSDRFIHSCDVKELDFSDFPIADWYLCLVVASNTGFTSNVKIKTSSQKLSENPTLSFTRLDYGIVQVGQLINFFLCARNSASTSAQAFSVTSGVEYMPLPYVGLEPRGTIEVTSTPSTGDTGETITSVTIQTQVNWSVTHLWIGHLATSAEFLGAYLVSGLTATNGTLYSGITSSGVTNWADNDFTAQTLTYMDSTTGRSWGLVTKEKGTTTKLHIVFKFSQDFLIPVTTNHILVDGVAASGYCYEQMGGHQLFAVPVTWGNSSATRNVQFTIANDY